MSITNLTIDQQLDLAHRTVSRTTDNGLAQLSLLVSVAELADKLNLQRVMISKLSDQADQLRDRVEHLRKSVDKLSQSKRLAAKSFDE